MLLSIATLLFAVTGLALAFVFLPPVVPFGLLGLLLAVSMVHLRRQHVGLLGPVFRADLLRSTRRTQVFTLRTIYLAIVLIVLLQVHAIWRRQFPGGVGMADRARFTLALFQAFLAVQLVVLLFVTPALTAGAIAEERERRSMAFLLATDLRDHEIVLGKFAARLVHLVGLLLAGLPVFFLLQLLGGIDSALVLLCFGGTLLTILSVSGVSLLGSVVSLRTRDALILVYGVVLGYLGLTIVVDYAVRLNELQHFPSTETWTSPVEVGDVVGLLTTGHPFYAMRRLVDGSSSRVALEVSGRYALFHTVLLAVTVGLAVILLRRFGVGDHDPTAGHTVKTLVRPGRTPWAQPILWREVCTERGLNASVPAHLFAVLAVLGSLVLAYWSCQGVFSAYEMNTWCRLMTALLGCMMLLQVVLRAAGSIRQERDRDTLHGLLATPLTGREILFGIWCGALASVQMLAVGLATVWVVGWWTGGLHLGAVFGQMAAWVVYAGVLAVVGLWISLRATSALRATLAAVGLTMLLTFGHWAIWLLILPMQHGPLAYRVQFDPLVYTQMGLTPPVAFAFNFGFSAEPALRGENTGPLFVYALAALLIWGLFGLWLWRAVVRQFEARFYRKVKTPILSEK